MARSKMAVHFSSQNLGWKTPDNLLKVLKSMGLRFNMDLACTTEDCICGDGMYFDQGFDSLEQDWSLHARDGFWLWCNPPYGTGLKDWVKKAHEEAKRGARIVMLIPARTDTSYWHDYIFRFGYTVRWIRGRLKFSGAKNAAPFPSALVFFTSDDGQGHYTLRI